MTEIIEYAGPTGVRTPAVSNNRINTPMPGDLVFIPQDHPVRWNKSSGYGRIEIVGPHQRLQHDSDMEICVGGGGVFLYPSGSVEISGGPFTTVDQSMLEPTGDIEEASFWNFGDHSAGPGRRVDFKIPRPVFRLKLPDAEA